MAAKLSLLPDKTPVIQSQHYQPEDQTGAKITPEQHPTGVVAASVAAAQQTTASTGVNLMQLNENDIFGLEFDRIARQKNEFEQQQQQQQQFQLRQLRQQNFLHEHHLHQQNQQFTQQQQPILNRQGNSNFIPNYTNYAPAAPASFAAAIIHSPYALSNQFNNINNLTGNVAPYAFNMAAAAVANSSVDASNAGFYRTHARSQSCNNINYNQYTAYVPSSATHFNLINNANNFGGNNANLKSKQPSGIIITPF
jgi:hypothetical protein